MNEIQISSDAIFIADAHYNHNRQELFELLSHTRASQIILMGDIFDFVCSYVDYFIEQNYELITLINHLSVSRQIIYLEGNHDFALEKVFKNVLIVPRSKQPLIANLGAQKLALAHGDIFTPFSYNLFTALIRNKYVLKFLNSIDFNYNISIGINNWLKQKSICYTMANFDHFAHQRIQLYKRYNVDIIVEGHFHQGKSFKNYYNIPSYSCDNQKYGTIDNKEIITWRNYG